MYVDLRMFRYLTKLPSKKVHIYFLHSISLIIIVFSVHYKTEHWVMCPTMQSSQASIVLSHCVMHSWAVKFDFSFYGSLAIKSRQVQFYSCIDGQNQIYTRKSKSDT